MFTPVRIWQRQSRSSRCRECSSSCFSDNGCRSLFSLSRVPYVKRTEDVPCYRLLLYSLRSAKLQCMLTIPWYKRLHIPRDRVRAVTSESRDGKWSQKQETSEGPTALQDAQELDTPPNAPRAEMSHPRPTRSSTYLRHTWHHKFHRPSIRRGAEGGCHARHH